MGKTIEFSRPDGKTASGYYAEAPHEGAPGVVMFEEWWGTNDEIKGIADELAAGGFRVLVPDLFHGKVAKTRDEANHLVQGLNFTEAATQYGRGAAYYLKEEGLKVGVTGFCIGGALALLCAMHDSEFDAVAVFYGIPPAEAGDPGMIKIPIMGHWAKNDDFFSPDKVDKLEARLKEAGRAYEFYHYDAGHAFNNPKGIGNYHSESADLSMKRTIGFFKRALAS